LQKEAAYIGWRTVQEREENKRKNHNEKNKNVFCICDLLQKKGETSLFAAD
jgi:hypothetical protein